MKTGGSKADKFLQQSEDIQLRAMQYDSDACHDDSTKAVSNECLTENH